MARNGLISIGVPCVSTLIHTEFIKKPEKKKKKRNKLLSSTSLVLGGTGPVRGRLSSLPWSAYR